MEFDGQIALLSHELLLMLQVRHVFNCVMVMYYYLDVEIEFNFSCCAKKK